ncbi:MAG: hypothetical protein AAB373_04205 [Patescibacteria group bacterium]
MAAKKAELGDAYDDQVAKIEDEFISQKTVLQDEYFDQKAAIEKAIEADPIQDDISGKFRVYSIAEREQRLGNLNTLGQIMLEEFEEEQAKLREKMETKFKDAQDKLDKRLEDQKKKADESGNSDRKSQAWSDALEAKSDYSDKKREAEDKFREDEKMAREAIFANPDYQK